jgi:hypothetical protein
MREVGPLRMNPVTIGEDGHVLVDTDTVLERDPDQPPTYAPAPVLQSR